jgi:F-type H+-transporting ATPase subunit epsilon
MKTFEFSVVTPQGEVLHEQATSVQAPGTMGRFGVLAGHLPLVATLEPGVLLYRLADQEQKALHISSGILEVDQEKNVRVLCDEAETQ